MSIKVYAPCHLLQFSVDFASPLVPPNHGFMLHCTDAPGEKLNPPKYHPGAGKVRKS